MPAATPPLSDKTRAVAVAEVYRVVAPGVLGAAMTSIGVVGIFIAFGVTDRISGWMFAAYIVACALIHLVLRAVFMRDDSRMAHANLWGGAFAVIAFLEGVGWGWAPVGLVRNGDVAGELIALFATLSVATGAIVAFGAYRPAFIALFVPATVPGVINAALSHNRLQQATSFLLVVYVVAMGVMGVMTSGSFQRLVKLRLRAETLADELSGQIEIAEAANRAKSSFLAAASHDLRQPVHALGLFVGALRGMEQSAEAQRILERIEVSTQALDSLFTSLLDISRLDAGIVEVRRRAFLITPMVERICRDQASEARDKGLRLVHVPADLICHSDPILVERIIRNLVSNAVRYTEKGRVLVGCRRRADVVSIEVWDTGPGISDDQRDRIFQEYYQIGNPERDRSKGLGLGLAIVKRLTRLLDCPLALRTTPGRGSCFAIALPRAEAVIPVAPEDLDKTAAWQPMQRRLIVVIDDEVEIRSAMSTLLGRWGHHVIVAEGGDAAIAGLADYPTRPDLIISDFRLRDGETGVEVIETLRSEYNETIPAILITGDTAPERLVEARDSGLLILHKPVSNGRLRAAIANSLSAPDRREAAVR